MTTDDDLKMRKTSFLLVVFFCLRAMGQTNPLSASCQLFSAPPLQLRALIPESGRMAQPFANEAAEQPHPERLFTQPPTFSLHPETSVTNTFSEKLSSKNETDFDRQLYDRLERDGYFTRPEPENNFDRAMSAVFRPEIVQLGKASFSCSILTAIKRKNPLCLLNPILLNLSW